MDRLADCHCVNPLLCHIKSINLLRSHRWHENLPKGQLPIFSIEGSGGLMIPCRNNLRTLGTRLEEMYFIQANTRIIKQVRGVGGDQQLPR